MKEENEKVLDLEQIKKEKEFLNQSYEEIRSNAIEATKPLIKQFIDNDPILKENLMGNQLEYTVEFMTNRVAGYIVGMLNNVREKI